VLALRLTRAAHPAVQLRRLLVVAASAGTGFLLLCALGYALGHPGSTGAALLRLAWCMAPLAATVYFAVAVARTDPATKPRPGLSAIGLGPLRLMAVSATTTALSCTLGSASALLFFLHLRGDLTGMPFDGAAAESLAADQPLPLPGALTLLALVPGAATVAVALVLRPREASPAPSRPAGTYGRFGAYRRTSTRETFGAYGRFGRQLIGPTDGRATEPATSAAQNAQHGGPPAARTGESVPAAATGATTRGAGSTVSAVADPAEPSGSRTAAHGSVSAVIPAGSAVHAAGNAVHPAENAAGQSARHAASPEGAHDPAASHAALPDTVLADTVLPETAPTAAPSGLPWGITVLAAGLAVETYTSRTAPTPPDLTFSGASPGVLAGWALAAVGMALAGPGLTHLCGRLLQSARPGALRLLAGRILMAEATRIGRPLGVVCAVLAAAYAMALLHAPDGLSLGPLTTLGVLLVTGCTMATLLTAAVEARQARADTTAALLRLGAPATMLRSAAAVRAGALLALFGPLTLTVAELAALPLAR
jgi:multisubunit Na+/H+ antiporter MnhC subunit